MTAAVAEVGRDGVQQGKARDRQGEEDDGEPCQPLDQEREHRPFQTESRAVGISNSCWSNEKPWIPFRSTATLAS